MVIDFLVLWSICLSSLVLFKKDPEYLTRVTAQVFVPLIRFLLNSFVSCCFLVLQGYSFLISFFHLHLFDGVCLQDTQACVGFFSPSVLILSIWLFYSVSQDQIRTLGEKECCYYYYYYYYYLLLFHTRVSSSYSPTPPLGQDMTQGQFSSGV